MNSLQQDLDKLKGPPWVVKSQIHAGGRGAGRFINPFNNKGGVQFAYSEKEAVDIANAMLYNTLVTKQTGPLGKKVNRIFIEESCQIEREYYLSFLIDRNSSKLMMIVSSNGGIDIEDVAEKNPEKIHNVYFPTLQSFDINDNIKNVLNLNNDQFKQFKSITNKLGRVFVELDASTIEINPLAINKSGQLVLLDAKISLDDNALFRHPELLILKDLSEENEIELVNTEVQRAEIALDEVQERLEETEIFAPITGVIIEKLVEVGQIIASGISNVNGGTALATIADMSRLFIIADIDETDIGSVKKSNVPIELYLDGNRSCLLYTSDAADE